MTCTTAHRVRIIRENDSTPVLKFCVDCGGLFPWLPEAEYRALYHIEARKAACMFCRTYVELEHRDCGSYIPNPFPHAPTCPVLAARRALGMEVG